MKVYLVNIICSFPVRSSFEIVYFFPTNFKMLKNFWEIIVLAT